MKPRKENETDAQYIGRLEAACHSLRAQNRALRKEQDRILNVLLPAADRAGLVVQYAAEVTNTTDNPQVVATIKALNALGRPYLNEGKIEIPDLPELPKAEPEKFGGDVEMILLSALERAKHFRGPWEETPELSPKVNPVDLKSLDWTGLGREIFTALGELEFSRSMLRMDLRSSMYDHCLSRIRDAAHEALARLEAEEGN